MIRLPIVAAAVLAIAASAPVICATTNPASAQGWRDSDDMDRDLRDLLRDRIRTQEDLRDIIVDLLHDRPDLRGRLRERISDWRDEDEGEGGLRGRLRGRINDWHEREGEGEGGWRGRLHARGLERGECLIITRSVRDEDRDFMVLVRRRVCPD
jgi:hypothetical protein